MRNPFRRPPAAPSGTYRGRLVCDGHGHLQADEGDWKGHPVYHDLTTNAYVFLAAGEPSHNDRYATGFPFVQPTRTIEDGPHHFQPTEDDPHWHQNEPTKTRFRSHPDADGPTVTSHTDAYTGRPQ